VPPEFEIVADGQLSTRNLIAGVEHLRELGVEDKQIERLLKDEPIGPENRRLTEQYQKQLLGDVDFVKKWLSGDYAAKKEMATIKLHLLRPIGKEI